MWADDLCLQSRATDPVCLLEELMAAPGCAAFGPVHHFLVGAALLSCMHNMQAAPDRDERLRADLAELHVRSDMVPGAACARWGVCGAAASVGMAYAIACGNAPLRERGWSEGQRLVSSILGAIADAGAPRCCKRDARMAVSLAAGTFAELAGCVSVAPGTPVAAIAPTAPSTPVAPTALAALAVPGAPTAPTAPTPVCRTMADNTVCLGDRCPYHPGFAREGARRGSGL